MPLSFRQLQNIKNILSGVEAGRIPAGVASKALSQSPEATQALQTLMGVVSKSGLDVFDRRPGALAKVGDYGRYDLPSMGAPGPGATFGVGPRYQDVPRIVERPSALVPSPGGAVDYPGFMRRNAQELLNERLGALPGGQRTFGVEAVEVREIPSAGMGFPTQPNVSRGIPVGSTAEPGRMPQTYRTAVEPPSALGGGPLAVVRQEPPGALALRGEVYPEGGGLYGRYTRHPDLMGERRAGMEPGTAPLSEEVLQKVARDLSQENALTGGLRQGDLGSILRTVGIASGAGLGSALLTRLLGIGRPSESVAPGQINRPAAPAVAPGTVPSAAPPSALNTPGQRTGGVENAPASPAPKSPAGQVIIESPGDVDERLREQMQQYAGTRGPSGRPAAAAPSDKKLSKFYAEQEAFGRANIDMIVDTLGLTGNLELWARSNPLNAAQLYLRTETKRQQATDLNQRTEFTSPQEIQPRGLSQQSPAIQGQMINTQLGSDFDRNRMGNINLGTEAAVNPSQGTYDLRDATTPLAQPTLMNPDAFSQQEEARREQMRRFIFENVAAGRAVT